MCGLENDDRLQSFYKNCLKTGQNSNMRSKHREVTRTAMLLLLSSVVCHQWKVEYGQPQICALKGSAVVIPCSFNYPRDMKVQSVKWAHERSHIYTGPFIYDSESNNTSPRYQYVGDKQHNCSLKIQHVAQEDSGKFAFRFIVASADGVEDRWTGHGGSRLLVADLKIKVVKTSGNETLMEGDSVQLTCSNECDRGGLSSFTWLKDGQPMHEASVLHLSNISHTDSGNYSCSLNTQRRPTSDVVSVDAEYGPKNISVSVRPSTDVDIGGIVTLVCRSTANPAVDGYTWFKRGDEDAIVGNGPELNIVDIHHPDVGQYLCRASNKHGHHNSSVVTITVKAHWPTFTRNALIVAAVALLMVTALIATTRCFKRKLSAPKIIRETHGVEDTQNTVDSHVFANMQPDGENQREGITSDIVYATVDFSSKRKPSTRQQQTGDKDDGVIYSTVCSFRELSRSYVEQL